MRGFKKKSKDTNTTEAINLEEKPKKKKEHHIKN